MKLNVPRATTLSDLLRPGSASFHMRILCTAGCFGPRSFEFRLWPGLGVWFFSIMDPMFRASAACPSCPPSFPTAQPNRWRVHFSQKCLVWWPLVSILGLWILSQSLLWVGGLVSWACAQLVGFSDSVSWFSALGSCPISSSQCRFPAQALSCAGELPSRGFLREYF